jgi:hypothetical protein
MLHRGRGLWNRRRSADQADEVVVALARLENIGVEDGDEQEKHHHHGLHAVAENKLPPWRARLGKKA